MITVLGVNDTPVAVDDTDVVTENQTITKTGAQDDVLNDDTDADESATLTVTAIQPSGGSSSNVSGSTYDSSGTSVTGTYGYSYDWCRWILYLYSRSSCSRRS